MKRFLLIIWLVCSTFVAQSIYAKVSEPPYSETVPRKSLVDVELITIEPLDRFALLSEDLRLKNGTDALQMEGSHRFAEAAKVHFNLKNSGTWQMFDDGRLWRLRIRSENSLSMNLAISEAQLPVGSNLWVYDPELEYVEGAYSSVDIVDGELWTPIILGDEIVVELFVPMKVENPSVTIIRVNRGYRALGAGTGEGLGDYDECCLNEDVVCPFGDSVRDQIRSVMVYTIDGTAVCSGQLVNHYGPRNNSFVLSAEHCAVREQDENSLVFFWNFQSSVCGDREGGTTRHNQNGATIVAENPESDFRLMKLYHKPNKEWNVYSSGWDAREGTNGRILHKGKTFAIHHPHGNEKAIALNTDALQNARFGGIGTPANHWLVDNWEHGIVENRSSGSCLWVSSENGEYLCIGVLSGPPSSRCSIPTSSSYYGKLSSSWYGLGTERTSLQPWLDPVDTNGRMARGAYR